MPKVLKRLEPEPPARMKESIYLSKGARSATKQREELAKSK